MLAHTDGDKLPICDSQLPSAHSWSNSLAGLFASRLHHEQAFESSYTPQHALPTATSPDLPRPRENGEKRRTQKWTLPPATAEEKLEKWKESKGGRAPAALRRPRLRLTLPRKLTVAVVPFMVHLSQCPFLHRMYRSQ